MTHQKKFFTKNRITQIEKLTVQIVFLFLFPEIFSTAFSGAKYIATRLGEGKYIEINSFVITLILMCILTIIFGRFFCTNLCAYGSSQDILNLISRPVFIKKRPRIPSSVVKVLNNLKYIVLIVVLVLCFTGGWQKTAGMSPWDVFSMITAGNFRIRGYRTGLIILIFIAAACFMEPRFFCRFLCPMGAVYSLLPTIGISKPKKWPQIVWLIIRAVIYGILFYMVAKVAEYTA